MSRDSFLMRCAVLVASWAYEAVTSVRNLLYDRGVRSVYRSRLPVVSVGNLTAGGNGKTPLCLYLVQELAARGLRPVILSRGYGGRLRGPHVVGVTDLPDDVGDEPLLMARVANVPVVIARKRVAGAKMIESRGLGDVIILDDGFQHRQLARDVDIVSAFLGSVESRAGFLKGHLLPRGMFREDRERGLRRASLFVVSSRSVVSPGSEMPSIEKEVLACIPSGVTVFRAAFEFVDVRSLADGALVSPRPVHALAGIANPEGFFQSLEDVGFRVEKKHVFRDHHPFSKAEVSRILEQCAGGLVVCTEKDSVKIREMGAEIAKSFAEFRVRLKVAPADAFVVAIMRAIENARSS